MVQSGGWKPLARELTAWELLRRIKEGQDIALLPVGSVEMHGPQQPLGTDSFIAEAVARLAAVEMKGTVFDTISYTWPGCTKYSRPTISMTMDIETRYTRMVCDELRRNGFGRIYVLQWHGPGIALTRLAREFFEETGGALAFYSLMRMPDQGIDECKQVGADWEASLCAAAAEFLGYDATVDPGAWDGSPPPEPSPGKDAQTRIRATGGITGGLGSHDFHHRTFADEVNKEVGMTVLRKFAGTIASSAGAMAEWRDAWAGRDLPNSWKSEIID